MNRLDVHLERVRRRWALVLVIVVAAAAAAVVGLVIRPESWTGRAALAIVSQNRSPDQDAVLGRGYVDLFNQPSQQQVMAARLGLGPQVVFSARLAAGSPILYVEATAPDPTTAARAATALASTFRDDVRDNLTGDRVAAAADLTNQLRAAQARLAALSPSSPDRDTVNTQINSLQSQLSTLQSNTTNLLKDLQLDAGVTENTTDPVRVLAPALLGGLVAGVALALALGQLQTRIASPAEARARLGREVLAEVVDGPDPRGLRALADVLALPDLPVPGALAVVAAGPPGRAKRSVATSLAELRTRQRGSTLLLRADPDGRDGDAAGVSDFLEQDTAAGLDLGALVVPHGPLWVVPPGRPVEDLDAICSREGARDLLDRARTLADVVIADLPPASTAAAGLLLCAAADRTVLVVEAGVTRTADARRALDRAERAGARIMGLIMVRGSGPAPAPPAPPAATPARAPALDEPHPATDPVRPRPSPSPRSRQVPHGVGG